MKRMGALLAASFAVFAYALPSLAQTTPTCATFDERNQSTTTFRGGEVIIVRGTSFAPRSDVRISFQQSTRSAELAVVKASDLGAFSTAGDVKLPTGVTAGAAQIRALDGSVGATCTITLTGNIEGVDGEDEGTPVLLFVWGGALALAAIVLVVITARRWQAGRLQRAMAELPDPEGVERPSRVPDLDPDDLLDLRTTDPDPDPEAAPTRPRRLESLRTRAPAPALEDEDDDAIDEDDDDDLFNFEEVDDDEFAGAAELGELDEDDEDDEDDGDEVVAVRDEPSEQAKPEVSEPPRLPPDWDAGPLRPRTARSDTVARLQEQVKDWKSR